ncbi:MAG: RnfABCDGE type electron transport complex subunit D [Desulfovibrionales bacterium]
MEHAAAKSPLLNVASPPHWHSGRTVQRTMLDFIIALMPALAMAVYSYGLDALSVVSLSVVTAVVTEALCCRAMHREVSVDDYSAVVIGMLFAFLLPAQVPWWIVVMGAALSVALGKMAFGGLGASPVSAPLVGWAAVQISWPAVVNVNTSMLASPLENPLTQLKFFGLHSVDVSFWDMLLGSQLGYLGSTQVLPLLLGGIYLVARGTITIHIPAAFLGGVFLTGLIYRVLDGSVHPNPLFHILAGSTVFGAFYLATDHSSSPVGSSAMLLYGLLGGVMVVIIRIYGIYPDGVPFAVLLANLFAFLLDQIRPKPFGAR